jgi:N-acetylmuramoyl-L-alanine amidase
MLMRTVLMAPVALAVATMRPESVVTLDPTPPKATLETAPPGVTAESKTSETAFVATVATVARTESAGAPEVKEEARSVEVTEAATSSDDDPKTVQRSVRCLALNIYHEARSESEEGQLAVAAVTLNRVASESFPDSVCAVVKQGGQKRHHCQFSWWCDGKEDVPTEKSAWQKALRISRLSLNGVSSDPTNGALYYHTTAVKPKWSRTFKRTARIGQHVFYRPAKSAPMRLAGLQ